MNDKTNSKIYILIFLGAILFFSPLVNIDVLIKEKCYSIPLIYLYIIFCWLAYIFFIYRISETQA